MRGKVGGGRRDGSEGGGRREGSDGVGGRGVRGKLCLACRGRRQVLTGVATLLLLLMMMMTQPLSYGCPHGPRVHG